MGFTPAHSIASSVGGMWAMLGSRADPTNAIYYNIRWLEALIDMERRLRRMGGSAL